MVDDLDPVPADPITRAIDDAQSRGEWTPELIDLPATPAETLAAGLAILAEDLARTLVKGEFAYGPDFDRALLSQLVDLVVILLPDLPELASDPEVRT